MEWWLTINLNSIDCVLNKNLFLFLTYLAYVQFLFIYFSFWWNNFVKASWPQSFFNLIIFFFSLFLGCCSKSNLANKSEEVYEAIICVFSSITGLITFFPDGTIHSVNHHFALMLFGYSSLELIGKVRQKWTDFGAHRKIPLQLLKIFSRYLKRLVIIAYKYFSLLLLLKKILGKF